MYRTLLGEAGFRKGMDLYFERHDGQAVSCDDFRAAMADANKVDLNQFERWYLQVREILPRLKPDGYGTSVCFCQSRLMTSRTVARCT